MENKTDFGLLGFRTFWVVIVYLCILAIVKPETTLWDLEGFPILIGAVLTNIFFIIELKKP